MKYKVMVMAFDGDIKIERPEFDTVDDAAGYANNLGSKWWFFPFEFIITETEKTVVKAPDRLEFLEDKRIKTVQKLFNQIATDPEMEGADVDEFVLALNVEHTSKIKEK